MDSGYDISLYYTSCIIHPDCTTKKKVFFFCMNRVTKNLHSSKLIQSLPNVKRKPTTNSTLK